jgi:hypothetical protein
MQKKINCFDVTSPQELNDMKTNPSFWKCHYEATHIPGGLVACTGNTVASRTPRAKPWRWWLI